MLSLLLQDTVEVLNSKNKQQQTDTHTSSVTADEFNSFQFWREPLAPIDDGLLDLLVSPTNIIRWTQTQLVDILTSFNTLIKHK